MSFVGESFDKSNFTVKGTDGKIYSAAAQFLESMGGSTTVETYQPEEMKEDEDLRTYFYEYSSECDCCKGLVYNCRGM